MQSEIDSIAFAPEEPIPSSVASPKRKPVERLAKWTLPAVLGSSVIFVALFHRQSLGINLPIFELLVLAVLIAARQVDLRRLNRTVITLGFLLTGMFTVITHSTFVYVMHFISIFLFMGMLVAPQLRSLLTGLVLGILNLFGAQVSFVERLMVGEGGGLRLRKWLWKTRIYTIPAMIILVFIAIYRASNPVFDGIFYQIELGFEQIFGNLFHGFDGTVVFTWLGGLFLANAIFIRFLWKDVIAADSEATTDLQRQRNRVRRKHRMRALISEYRAGIFLLIVLNALLLLVNAIDVKYVWFDFSWEGQGLKQYVHDGTYLLILSILISIGIVLYFFRGNLNFYRRNRLLKGLAYLWVAQNALLALSVGIRNYHYIEHWSLAYLRIGVMIFLAVTLIGLYTVGRKVRDGKSSFYLLKTNALSIYIILTFSSFVNWDVVIARYNFAHKDQGFVHLNYLMTLSDKALPYLDSSTEELEAIYQQQPERYSDRELYMAPDNYKQEIDYRKEKFLASWEAKGILEWNWAEWRAYRELTKP